MNEKKLMFERLLNDDLTGELEAQLDEVLSAASPDYDEAERLTSEILAMRGEKPQKINVSQAVDDICGGAGAEAAAEVTELEVVDGKRSRRGIRAAFYGVAAAALVAGSIAAVRQLSDSAPTRVETPPEMVAQISTTGQKSVSKTVTTAAFAGDTVNTDVQAEVQTTAPAQQQAVQTTVKPDAEQGNVQAVNDNAQQQDNGSVQTSPAQEQTTAQAAVTTTAAVREEVTEVTPDHEEMKQLAGIWEVYKITQRDDDSETLYSEYVKLSLSADGKANLWDMDGGMLSYPGSMTWAISNGRGAVTCTFGGGTEVSYMEYRDGVITLTDPNITVMYKRYEYIPGDVNKNGYLELADAQQLVSVLELADERAQEQNKPLYDKDVQKDLVLYDFDLNGVLDINDQNSLMDTVYAMIQDPGDRGDVNHDGILDNLDAMMILTANAEAVGNQTPDGKLVYSDEVIADMYYYDYNLDGTIDNIDAALILAKLEENQ